MKDFNDPSCILDDLSDMFRSRGEKYQNSYKQVGAVMKVLYPDGVQAKTQHELNRLYLLTMVVIKLIRFVNSNNRCNDSLEDASVYCAMLRRLIEEQGNAKEEENRGEPSGVSDTGIDIFTV